MPKQISPWDDQAKVDQLRNLWTEGFSASQIAREIGGVTRCAVIGKAHRLRLKPRGNHGTAARRHGGPIVGTLAHKGG